MSSTDDAETTRCELCDTPTDNVGVLQVNTRVYLDPLCPSCDRLPPAEAARRVLDAGGPTFLLTAVERDAVALDDAREAVRRSRRDD